MVYIRAHISSIEIQSVLISLSLGSHPSRTCSERDLFRHGTHVGMTKAESGPGIFWALCGYVDVERQWLLCSMKCCSKNLPKGKNMQ